MFIGEKDNLIRTEMEHPCYSLDNYFAGDKPCLSFNIEALHHDTPYNSTEMHRHDYYEIYLFEKGGGHHAIEFDSFKIDNNSVSVIFPRQFHLINIDKEAKGKIIMFNEELFCSEILRKELRAYCVDLQMRLNNLSLNASQFTEIAELFVMIENLFGDLNVIRKEQIRHLIKIILLKLMDMSKSRVLTKQEATESNAFVEFTNLVDRQFKEIRFVNEYSEQMGLPSKKLNALTKKYSGQTALQVIHDRIFLEAKRMLAFSGLSHKEIAYELKFDSPSAFNKFIHAKTQCSPSELQFKLTNIYNKGD
ncbi:helix-turn-helix domain-containing protein [Marinilabiliaceae bacterium JC017]|nr:helix-turn-helix domain-containing protein [Marinilabiliaceae bacterium JC017]